MLRAEQGREHVVNGHITEMEKQMAVLTEKFDQRFQTNEMLKNDIDH